ncbi:MAG: transporter [Caulobacteraceae bacterium]|jgi:NodT family efflux transporter outer membrane factor (OMF) lipoprotein|nr:transporter [Caulobacteraceae bacterium]
MSGSSRTPSVAALLTVGALLAACAVGPDYKGPPQAAPLSTAAGRFQRSAQIESLPGPPAARWWEALNEPELSRLIDQALADSPTVREAQARVRAARASLGATRAALLPNGGAAAFQASARIPKNALGGLTGVAPGGVPRNVDIYSAGFDALWELDVFGGTRRAIEAAGAEAGAQQAQLQDAQVELSAEVAQAYVNLRDTQARLRLAQDAVALQQRTLDLTRQRRAVGAAADGDIERVRTDLEQSQAEIPSLEGLIQQITDQIAVLTGREPGALDVELAASATIPKPPAATPIGDPAALLRRRPDIRAAERRLAASSARIGQNVAELFPKVTLFGDIGFSATSGDLFKSGNFGAIGGPSLTWNLFSFPRLQARVRGAEADRDAVQAHYEGVVLAALEDAETSLTRYGHQRQSLAALARAEASAVVAAELTSRRYQGGTASLIDVLDAQRRQIQARRAVADGQAQLVNDYVALQKSLGLGWAA